MSIGSASDANYGAIVLAVYKPDRMLLARQISSIRSQTHSTWTCIVVVDGDNEGATLVKELTEGDHRFRVLCYPNNVGFYRNFERGLEAVPPEAKWVALSDQDDTWDRNKLSQLLPLLGPSTSVAGGQGRLIDYEGNIHGVTTRRSVSQFALLLDNQITGSFTVFRRDVIDLALPFPSPTSVSYHDHWLGFVALNIGDSAWLRCPVQDYVQHEANVVGELSPGRFSARIVGLHEKSLAGVFDRLQYDRWGWRASMARALTTRCSEIADPAIVEISTGHYSWGLLRRVAQNVVTKQVEPLRGAALLVGAVLAKSGRSRKGRE